MVHCFIELLFASIRLARSDTSVKIIISYIQCFCLLSFLSLHGQYSGPETGLFDSTSKLGSAVQSRVNIWRFVKILHFPSLTNEKVCVRHERKKTWRNLKIQFIFSSQKCKCKLKSPFITFLQKHVLHSILVWMKKG